MGPSEFNGPSTRRLALDSTSSYQFLSNCTHLTCRNFICQHSAITETTIKQRPLAIIWFDSYWESHGFVGTHAIFSGINTRDASLRDTYSIMMLVKFLTSANQMHRILSCDESGLCNPRPRLLGDEVVVGPWAVVSFPGRWWHHNDLNLGTNPYSLFRILTSFVHMTYQFAHRQAVSWAVNGSRRFRGCLTLPILH